MADISTGMKTSTIWIIVLIIAIVIIVIVFIVYAATRDTDECSIDSDCSSGVCVDGSCKSCGSPPSPPSSVTIIYDRIDGTATLYWVESIESRNTTSYCIYRSFEDPGVGKNSFDQVVKTVNRQYTFEDLEEGSHYFVVTAKNLCGESTESAPYKIAPSCGSVPPISSPPSVTQDSDLCTDPEQAEVIEIDYTDQSIPDGGYIITGNNQIGDVSNYFFLEEGGSPSSAVNFQKCNGVTSTHSVSYVTEWTDAELDMDEPDELTGTTFEMKWKLVTGAEEYAVWLVAIHPVLGIPYFYGGYAPGGSRSIHLDVQSGLEPVFGVVVGYKLCDKSNVSTATPHTTPTP